MHRVRGALGGRRLVLSVAVLLGVYSVAAAALGLTDMALAATTVLLLVVLASVMRTQQNQSRTLAVLREHERASRGRSKEQRAWIRRLHDQNQGVTAKLLEQHTASVRDAAVGTVSGADLKRRIDQVQIALSEARLQIEDGARQNEALIELCSVMLAKLTAPSRAHVQVGSVDHVESEISARLTDVHAWQVRIAEELGKVPSEAAASQWLWSELANRPVGTPLSGGWAMMPSDTAAVANELLVDHTIQFVLELGSGTSTLWMALALARRGQGRVIAVEHSLRYAEATRATLEMHGLTEFAEVVVAPLTDVDVEGAAYTWYSPAFLKGLSGIDLLLVDGPPGNVGPMARYPALPLCAPALSSRARVVLDDAFRQGETAVIERWTASSHASGILRRSHAINRALFLDYRRGGAE